MRGSPSRRPREPRKTYTFTHYLRHQGLPYSDNYPAAGGLPTEIVTYTYASAWSSPTAGRHLLRLRQRHQLHRLRTGRRRRRHGHQPGQHHQHLRRPHRLAQGPMSAAHSDPHHDDDRRTSTTRPATSPSRSRPASTTRRTPRPSATVRRPGPAHLGLDRHRRLPDHTQHRQPLHGRRRTRHHQRLLDQLDNHPSRPPRDPDPHATLGGGADTAPPTPTTATPPTSHTP